MSVDRRLRSSTDLVHFNACSDLDLVSCSNTNADQGSELLETRVLLCAGNGTSLQCYKRGVLV